MKTVADTLNDYALLQRCYRESLDENPSVADVLARGFELHERGHAVPGWMRWRLGSALDAVDPHTTQE